MIQQAIRTIRTLLPSSGSVTSEQIEEAVADVIALNLYKGVDHEALLREVQAIYSIRLDEYRIIESSERRRPWIGEKKASINWNFWARYRDYLEVEKNYSSAVISQLDRLTDRTLDGLFDPTIAPGISKYGLVVGQVQSGKTSNYTGLICKAADAGYKLIIVLAGIHNNLRSQTQLRLDEGFLGFDTQHQRAFAENNMWIGVGRINQNSVAHSLTSSLDRGDFTAGAANGLGLNFSTNEPIIAVVKKNAAVLNRLLTWLSAQATDVDGKRIIKNKSLLLIDDEADNASINTNPENDKSTRINGQIREIIGLFNKSGYVGYTATPFANIFIPIAEDDLFPRDFIINIPAPSNYIGPEKVFGFSLTDDEAGYNTVLPIVRRIDDYAHFVPNAHKSTDALPSEAPESLRDAIKCFLITCTIRRVRGQVNTHNSMLVHVSRFVAWQRQIKTIVEQVFEFYRRGIEMNIPSVLEELRSAFQVDTETYKSYTTTSQQVLDSPLAEIDPYIQVHSWEDLLPQLNEAASRITVREINGGSADALNFYDHKNGLSVIAVGGDKLSRGLTLEGLSVSYYLRASRMYDTLMQMGRWFGYRPGYVDLCRLFTSRELNEWFCHITLASEELRNEFDYMADVAGSTPEQYALRVRTHPGVLQISASNKIRRAVTVQISWSGRLVESYEFSKKPEVIKSNLNATIGFIKSLPESDPISKGSNYLWYNIPINNIKLLLQNFKLSENLKAADPNNLLRFIDAQSRNGELTKWTVAIMSKGSTNKRVSIEKANVKLDVGFFLRRDADQLSNSDIYFIKKSHIISPRDEFIDLSDEEYKIAWEKTKAHWKQNEKQDEPLYPSGEVVRNEIRNPEKPLLLLYFLDPEGAKLPNNSNPIVGYAISFPKSKFNLPVSYAVNEQLLSVFNQEDNSFEESEEDEED